MENAGFSKVCKKCQGSKDICEFGKNSRIIGGISHACKDCVNAKNREHIAANPEKYKASKDAWAAANKEKVLEIKYNWIKRNPEKRRQIMRTNKKRRYHTELKYKLVQNIRNRMGGLFKKTPSTNTLKLLGCSVEEYKAYLESKFLSGMNWQNHKHNGWHIDHIVPIDSFDLTKEEEIKKAFHFSNTQPLWSTDNFKKKDKLNWSKNA